MKRVHAAIVGVLIVAVASYFCARHFAALQAERFLIELHPKGAATPATFGAPFEEVPIFSGERRLDAALVRAPTACDRPVAVLIFHGRGETISDWAKVQAWLRGQCISSLVFDYAGHGASTGVAHMAALNADAAAAYGAFVRRFPGGVRRCILGHSMGNSPMLHAYPAMAPPPDCVIDANAFSSVAEMAAIAGAPRQLLFLLDGVWDNSRAIAAVHAPLMLIHSDADLNIPPAIQDKLAAAAPAGALRVTVHGFQHDALYEQPDGGWWTPVTPFLRPPLAAGAPSH
jgi:uncharacterized protein